MKKPLKTTVWLCGSVIAVWVAYWFIPTGIFGDAARSGQYGDSFGALNTLFTGLTFAVLSVTLIEQWRQIAQTRMDLRDERNLRLRLDLYDKRFRVYEATVDFVGRVFAGPDSADVSRFDVARREASFLFAGDTNLMSYLEELRKNAHSLALWRSQAKQQANPQGEAARERDRLTTWFERELATVPERFASYLSFGS